MLDPRLFKLPGFGGGAGAITAAFFSMFGMFFLLTLYLQYVKGYSPLGAGLRVLPNAVAMMVVSPQAPRLLVRLGVKRMMRSGFFLTAVGFIGLATATRSTSDIVVVLALLCTGTGMALVMPGASQHVVGGLPLSKAGVGSAVNDVTREVGGALGIAVAGSIVATAYRGGAFIDQIPGSAGPAREIASQSIGQAHAVALRAVQQGLIDQPTAERFLAAAGDAFNHGTRIAFLVMACVAVLAGALVGRVIPDQLPGRHPAGD